MSLYVPVFEALNDMQVRYVVVGGLATVLHGYARLTADIDLMVDLEPEELRKSIDALAGHGMVPRSTRRSFLLRRSGYSQALDRRKEYARFLHVETG
jgi:hypothetical protein